MISFKKLGIENWLCKVCEKIGYEHPTKIQEMALPTLLKNENCIINAETGCGKTATFAFPILQNLAKELFGIHSLIITPSRELALQIYEQICIFGEKINIRCVCLIGGIDIIKQLKDLESIPHIIVGTPGRISDMIEKSQVFSEYLENLKTLVLDEADRLFESSLFVDIEDILKKLPKEKQIVLATATLNEQFTDDKISQLMDQDLKMKKFTQNNQKLVVQTLKQSYVFIPSLMKDFYFVKFIKDFNNQKMVIFVNTCKNCQIIGDMLNLLGIPATVLHSYMKQGDRIKNIKNFRNQRVNILVATDVVSRGLDIPMVDIVINFDIPRNQEDYVHRVGRTARKGKRGFSCSFVTQHDVQLLLDIETYIGEKLSEYNIEEKDAMELVDEVSKAKKKIRIKHQESGLDDKFEIEEKAKQQYKKSVKQKIKQQQQFKKIQQQQQEQLNQQ